MVLGTLAAPWRARVDPSGRVVVDDGSPPLDWWVAADDRWHDPAREPSVQQRRLEGAPVVETVLRVPDGQAVHRAWAVPDAGGVVVVEIENRSPLPFAIAFSRSDLVTARPPADIPIRGIDLPAGSITLPVGHRATVRVALPVGRRAVRNVALGSLPPAGQVARGWVTVADRSTRLVLPDTALGEWVIATRCDLLLGGPPDHRDDPTGFLLALGELVRLGERPERWSDDVALAAERVALSLRRQRVLPWDVRPALEAAALVLERAVEARAAADAAAVSARLAADEEAIPPWSELDGVRLVAALVRGLVAPTSEGADLFRRYPSAWYGQGLEVYGAPAHGGTVSVGVRWHGARPALLWEASAPMVLTASHLDPAWRATAARGEALLGVPPDAPPHVAST